MPSLTTSATVESVLSIVSTLATATAPVDSTPTSRGWIYGVVVGGIVFIAAVIGFVIYSRQRRSRDPFASQLRNYETFLGPIGALVTTPPSSESGSPDDTPKRMARSINSFYGMLPLNLHYTQASKLILPPLSPVAGEIPSAATSASTSPGASRHYDDGSNHGSGHMYDRVPPVSIHYDQSLPAATIQYDRCPPTIIYDNAVPK